MNAEKVLADLTGSSQVQLPSRVEEWGWLENEPCCFCRKPGGVFFMIDPYNYFSGSALEQVMRCSNCRRTWIADSAIS